MRHKKKGRQLGRQTKHPVSYTHLDVYKRQAQTSRDHDLDSLGPQTKSRLHTALHRATKCNALLQLGRHILANQLRIQFRLLNFFDRDVRLTRVFPLQSGLELVNLGAFAPNDNAWTCLLYTSRCV